MISQISEFSAAVPCSILSTVADHPPICLRTPALPALQCKICFEDFPRSSMRSAACKHGFCTDCWAGYLANGVTSGPSVLDLRCPLPTCKAEVRCLPARCCC